MDNARLIELLARKWAKEATPSELEELSVLMDRYPDAVYYEEFLAQLWYKPALPDLHDETAANSYQAHKLKFHEEFSLEEYAEPKGKGSSLARYLLAGMAVCLVFFMGLLYHYSGQQDEPDTQIISARGVRKKLKLPDGTLVWLNSDSKLTFDSNINKKNTRIVHLEGEAFFDVAHAKNHPFIVYTDKAAVKVLGTAFNIRAYPSDKCSETTLLRGSIEFSVIGRPEQKIVLNPSEKIALKEAGKVILVIKHISPVKIGRVDYIQETSWKDNSLVFRNETLEELKPKLERWFNVSIQINSEQAKSYHFTGIFKNESISQALTAMQLIKPFTFDLTAHDVIIY